MCSKGLLGGKGVVESGEIVKYSKGHLEWKDVIEWRYS